MEKKKGRFGLGYLQVFMSDGFNTWRCEEWENSSFGVDGPPVYTEGFQAAEQMQPAYNHLDEFEIVKVQVTGPIDNEVPCI